MSAGWKIVRAPVAARVASRVVIPTKQVPPVKRLRLAWVLLGLLAIGRPGIAAAQTPDAATNERVTGVWELYGPSILLGGALIVMVQSALIAALLIQRARRVRDERALRATEERIRFTADRAPVMMWTTRPDATLDYLNHTCTEFTGLPLEQMLGNGWLDAVHPDDVDYCVRTYTPAIEAHTPFRMEYRIRRADGVYRWVLDLGLPRYGPDGSYAGFVGSTVDITDRKDMEDALLENQKRYALATAAGAVGVWDWNLDTNDMYVDPTLKSILGFDDAEIPNRMRDWGSRVHPLDAAAVMARAQACIDGDTDLYEAEHRMLHKDGSVRWFLARGSVMRRADGTAHRMVGTDTDVTDRRRAEESIREKEAILQASDQQIQDLAGRLIAAQEVERARIARELHDDTSQQLAGLAIALSGLKRRVAAGQGDADLQEEVTSLQQRTIALAENIRHLSHDLHPSVLEHSGLVAALAAYCAEIQRLQIVDVTFSSEGDFESAGADVALCFYRIAQEALRNVVAHASARRADVRLLRTGDSAELTIVDDGKGFDIVGARENRTGLGLVSIGERVRLAGGTVSIATELNKGTRVRVQIPVNEHARAAAGAGPAGHVGLIMSTQGTFPMGA